MICFGAKTDQEVKENGTCGSHFKIKKNKKQNKNKTKQKGNGIWPRERNCVREKYFFNFYFLLLLSSIYGNRTVGIRRGKNEKALLDEGYAWEPKTRDFAEFSIKNFENPMFWFFSYLRLSDDQN